MELQINYLNNQVQESNGTDGKINETAWYSRWKTYKSDWMDEDMKNSTVSHCVDRIIINDCQLTSKQSIEDMIEFLKNAKESFRI